MTPLIHLDGWTLAGLIFAYFAAGFIDSIAGGGGLIGVPAFLLTGIPPEFVLGTNKMASSLGTGSSLFMYARSRMVAWKLAVAGLPAALAGGFLGSKAVLLLDSATIGKTIVFLLPLGIVSMLLPSREEKTQTEFTPLALYVVCPLICFVLGFYDGFFGPGTGSFFIMAFHFFLAMGLVQASATAKIFNLSTNIGSLVAFIWHGKVIFAYGVPLAMANITGNVLGSMLAIHIGAPFVRKVLILSLSILFISLCWKFFS